MVVKDFDHQPFRWAFSLISILNEALDAYVHLIP